jgi:hypothetical protein
MAWLISIHAVDGHAARTARVSLYGQRSFRSRCKPASARRATSAAGGRAYAFRLLLTALNISTQRLEQSSRDLALGRCRGRPPPSSPHRAPL